MRLYLDTSVIRLCIEGDASEQATALHWIERAEAAPTGTLLTSLLARTECLIKPVRFRNVARIQQFEEFFRHSGVVLVGVSDEILELATQVAADYHIRLADAIHTATAIKGRCDALVARDRPWTETGPVMGLPLLHFSDEPTTPAPRG